QPDGALGFRRAAFNVSATATWQDPALDDEQSTWARETAAAPGPWALCGGGRRGVIRAAARAQAALRPGERPAAQPERPAGRRLAHVPADGWRNGTSGSQPPRRTAITEGGETT